MLCWMLITETQTQMLKRTLFQTRLKERGARVEHLSATLLLTFSYTQTHAKHTVDKIIQQEVPVPVDRIVERIGYNQIKLYFSKIIPHEIRNSLKHTIHVFFVYGCVCVCVFAKLKHMQGLQC